MTSYNHEAMISHTLFCFDQHVIHTNRSLLINKLLKKETCFTVGEQFLDGKIVSQVEKSFTVKKILQNQLTLSYLLCNCHRKNSQLVHSKQFVNVSQVCRLYNESLKRCVRVTIKTLGISLFLLYFFGFPIYFVGHTIETSMPVGCMGVI